uniref:Transmembrane protein n=1 Tax=Globodera rostochiensis TaxID=31243 RepID=A0A914I0G9_GLORO
MNCKNFTFFICAIVQFLRAKEVQSNSFDQLQDQKSPESWHYLLQQNGLDGQQLKQMARDMDEDEALIDELSEEANYQPPPPSPAHPTFEKTYSMQFITPSVELEVNDQNKIQKLEGQSGVLAKVYRSLKLGKFYSLVRKYGIIAKSVQELAKSFGMLKHLMKKGTIERKIVDKIDNSIKSMAKQRKISVGKIEKFNPKMELREIVKNAAIVWSETARNKNYASKGQENVQKIVELWQIIQKNAEFSNYFDENESKKTKNQSQKRRAKRDPITAAMIILIVAFFVFLSIMLATIWLGEQWGDN